MLFKILVVVLALAAVSLAAPLSGDAAVKIVRYENENFEDGGYRFFYETSDGQKREETGTVTKIDDKISVLAVRGAYSYTGTDGQLYKVSYVADRNGFQPVGDHIPSGANLPGAPA